MKKNKKKFQMPSSFTILFFLIIAVAILTWIIPAGQYATNKAGEIIAGTYHSRAANPQGIWDVFMAPIKGMVGTEDGDGTVAISLFILVIGGFLGVVNKTKALDDGISSTLKKYAGKEKILIPILMTLFAIGGSTYGMGEETIAFYPILIAVMISVGFDSLVAIAIALVGSQVGVLASTVNPFATGVASQSLNISPGDGLIQRLILLVITIVISIIYVMRYANKVKQDPSKSLVFKQREEDLKEFALSGDGTLDTEMTVRQKAVLWIFGITFVVMVAGLIPWSSINASWTFFDTATKWITGIPFLGNLIGHDMAPFGTWYFSEMTMLFLFMSVVVMFVYKMKESDFIDSFLGGMNEFLSVAIVIAVARGIQVVMNDGQITATVLHAGEQGLQHLPAGIFIVLTFIFYIPMSFLIPSTSGLAAATMGIMGPLGKFSGVTPDLVITAYQAAVGWVNIITPTSGIVMGALAIAHVNIVTWFKFTAKLMGILLIVTIGFLVICTLI